MDDRCFEKAIEAFFQDPYAFPSTDLRCYPPISKALGRMPAYTYGIFADFMGTFVRDKAALSLEEAIKKATYLPAQMLSLEGRGVLSPGSYADIVIFDFDRIKMTGTFLNPAQRPEGIEVVFVNGKIVYKDMAHTGNKPGKLIRHRMALN